MAQLFVSRKAESEAERREATQVKSGKGTGLSSPFDYREGDIIHPWDRVDCRANNRDPVISRERKNKTGVIEQLGVRGVKSGSVKKADG